MGRSALHGETNVSLLICASELAGACGKINVESLCTGLDLSPGFSDFGRLIYAQIKKRWFKTTFLNLLNSRKFKLSNNF